MDNYVHEHTNEDYDIIKNLSDEELVYNYLSIHDSLCENALAVEMIIRFIDLVMDNYKKKESEQNG
jgi:hypothetical protein